MIARAFSVRAYLRSRYDCFSPFVEGVSRPSIRAFRLAWDTGLVRPRCVPGKRRWGELDKRERVGLGKSRGGVGRLRPLPWSWVAFGAGSWVAFGLEWGRKRSDTDDFGTDLRGIPVGRVGVLSPSAQNFFHRCKCLIYGEVDATLGDVFRSFSWEYLVGIGYLIYLCNRKRGNDLLQRMSHPSEGG